MNLAISCLILLIHSLFSFPRLVFVHVPRYEPAKQGTRVDENVVWLGKNPPRIVSHIVNDLSHQ